MDDDTRTLRARVVVKVRSNTREALERERYTGPALIVNLRSLARRTDKLYQMSRGVCPPAAIYLRITSGEHLFDLEPALSLLLKLTSTQRCSTTGFGRFGCRWWLQQLGEQQHRKQLFSTLARVSAVAAVVAGACWLNIGEAERRFCNLGRCGRPCSQRVIPVPCSGSCVRPPEAFWTLSG